MGVSGSGKGTLRKNLEKENIKGLLFLKSYVSRPMREGEINGDIYNFITKKEFLSSVDNDEFLEYALVHKTDYYGTKYVDIIDNGIKKGNKVIKELDINGLIKLKQQRPELSSNYTSIFLNIPTSELFNRIESRGNSMSKKELDNRLDSVAFEFSQAQKYCDYIIDATNSPTQVLNEFKRILEI